MHSVSRVGARILALLALLGAADAAAGLMVLGHERGPARQVLATLDPADGALAVLPATAVADCCSYAGALLAQDLAGQRAFAVSQSSAPASAVLHAWRLDAPGLTSATPLPAGTAVQALAWDPDGERLLAVVVQEGSVRIATLDVASGAVDPLTPVVSDCCVFGTGVATWDPDSDTFVFVAQQPGDGSGTARLFRVAVPSGATTRALLSRQVDYLWHSSATGLRAGFVQADHATPAQSRVGIGSVAADGSVTPVGTGLAGCCANLAGVGALSGGFLYRIGLRLDSGTLVLYRLALADGSGTLLGSWPRGLLPNALLATGEGEGGGPLPDGPIFRDGFEATALPPTTTATISAQRGAATGVPDLARSPGHDAASSRNEGAPEASGAKGMGAPAPRVVPLLDPLALACLTLLLFAAGAWRRRRPAA